MARRDLNRVTFTGRLPRDPELRVTPTGQSVATFSVACNRNIREGDNWREETEWFRVVIWRELAERMSNRLKKGSFVLVEGRLQTRKWNDQQSGQERTTVEVIANDVIQLDPKTQEGGGSNDIGDAWDNAGGGNSNGGGNNYSNSGSRSSGGNRSRGGEYGEEEQGLEDIPF